MSEPPSTSPDERLIEGILRTRFGKNNGPALEYALRRITAAESEDNRPIPFRLLAAAAAILLLASLAIFHQLNRTGLLLGPDTRTSTILKGDTFRSAKPGEALSSGQTLRSSAPLSLNYSGESTSLSLNPLSELLVGSHRSGKKLTLLRGKLHANVAPQEKPMEIKTPAGFAEVIGTRFSISSPPGATWLAVEEGIVRWNGSNSTPIPVNEGTCIVDSLGVNPGPHPLTNGNLPPRLPISWSWLPLETTGDGDWSHAKGTITQILLSTATEPSAYITETPTAASFRLEATATVTGFARDSSDKLPDSPSLRIRFDFEGHLLEFILGTNPLDARDPAATYQALSLTRLDKSLGFPSQILHGGLAPSFSESSYRLIFQLERELPGGAVIRGKIWKTDTTEPAYWSLQAYVPELGPLTRTGFSTARCTASFSEIRPFLIH